MAIVTGTLGNDIYLGTVGVQDTAEIGSSQWQVSLRFDPLTQRWIVTSPAGTDQLDSIERVQLTDASFTLSPGGDIRVNTTTANNQTAPKVTVLANGSYVITWQSAAQDTHPDPLNPAVNLTSTGIYSQMFTAAGEKIGPETRVNTTLPGEQITPQIVALANGGYAIAWASSAQDGDGYGVVVRVFSATGEAVGAEQLVNTTTTGAQLAPSLAALPSGGFVVTWDSNPQDGSGTGVYSQRFDATGVKLGAETLVNTNTLLDQRTSDVHSLADGGYVVTWYTVEAGMTNKYDIVFQRFDANGVAVGIETVVDQPGFDFPSMPTVTSLDNGGFVIGYASASQVFLQHFDASGAKVGVPSSIGSSSSQHDIVTLANGDYLVSWAWNNVHYAQRFDATGTKLGDQINITQLSGSYNDSSPSVAALSDGGFVVSWQSNLRDGSLNGIYSMRFAADNSPVLPTLTGDYLPNNLAYTGNNNVRVVGGGGNDLLSSGAGRDWLEGGAGVDEMRGGGGDDTYIADQSDLIVELANAGNDTVLATGHYTITSDHLENATLLGSAAGTLIGSNIANTLTGNAGDNTLNGGLGADRMAGGSGNDTYFVEDGFDAVNGDTTGDVVVEDANGGLDTVVSEIDYALGANLEALVLIGSASLNGVGNALDNQITGNAGNNRLDGGAGNDTLIGGAGNDTYVAKASDRIIEADGEGYDTVETAVSWALGDHLEALVLTGGAFINGTGNALNNTLIGNAAGNTLDGGAGADVMNGHGGSDTYIVDHIDDIAQEDLNSNGNDLVRSTVSHALGSGIENLTLLGTDLIDGTGNSLNNTLRGNSVANVLSGGSGVDILYGNYGDDTLISGDGQDRLYGGVGNDTYQVSGEADRIIELSAQGIDTVIASVSRAYTLGLNLENLILQGGNVNGYGNSAANEITGTLGANLIDGGGGSDRMMGLGGNDYYVVDSAGDRVIEVEGDGTDHVISSVSHTLAANVENLNLTGAAALNGAGNDLDNRMVGNDAANYLGGGNGNDILYGGGGNDLLYGGAGSDSLNGALGDDLMNGGEGNDRVTYYSSTVAVTVNLAITTAQDTIGAGIDTLVSIETVDGSNVGNDTLTGDGFNNRLDGHGGSDLLNGGAGNDTVNGGEGNDIIIGDLGNDVLSGGNGRDRLSFATSTVSVTVDLNETGYQNTGMGSDRLLDFEDVEGSNTGNDRLTGDSGNNDLFGLGGNDILAGGDGVDMLDGGEGSDTASFAGAGDGVIADLGVGSTVDDGFGFTDTFRSIENLLGSEFDDLLIGSVGDNSINGNAGEDIINGLEGADLLEGCDGDDRIDGGAGSDTLSYSTASAGVTVNLAISVNNTVGAGIDTLFSMENLVGSDHDDQLTGNSGGNRIYAGGGNDVLDGGASADLLHGGKGIDTATYTNAASAVRVDLAIKTAQDTLGGGVDTILEVENVTGSRFNDTLSGDALANVLTGGLGNDTLNGAAGLDTASYSTATTAVSVDLRLTTAQNTLGAGTDTLTNIENLTGSDLNDVLFGNSLGNVLNGGKGNDSLFALEGDDTLDGSFGDDRLDGGIGADTATYADALAAVTIDLALTSVQNTRGAGSDTLVDIENATGSAFDDLLSGNGGANVLQGGAGADTLSGRAGNDSLLGGTGTDLFLFDAALNGATNVDRILDFSGADDTIALGRSTFSALAFGELAASAFRIGAVAADADDRIIYDSTTGNIFYDADGSQAGVAVLFAQVEVGTVLTNGDFFVV